MIKIECDLYFICEKNINNIGWSNDGDCSINVCVDDYVNLSVNLNGLVFYEWEGLDGFFLISLSSDVLIVNSFELVDVGIYFVIVIDFYGCIVIIVIEVGLNSGCLFFGCISRVVSNIFGCLVLIYYGFWLEGVNYSFENGVFFEEFVDGMVFFLGRVNVNNGFGKWFDVYVVFIGRILLILLGSLKLFGCYMVNMSNWYYYIGIVGYIEGSEGFFNLVKRGEFF